VSHLFYSGADVPVARREGGQPPFGPLLRHDNTAHNAAARRACEFRARVWRRRGMTSKFDLRIKSRMSVRREPGLEYGRPIRLTRGA
jgi:hypothetical protein